MRCPSMEEIDRMRAETDDWTSGLDVVLNRVCREHGIAVPHDRSMDAFDEAWQGALDALEKEKGEEKKETGEHKKEKAKHKKEKAKQRRPGGLQQRLKAATKKYVKRATKALHKAHLADVLPATTPLTFRAAVAQSATIWHGTYRDLLRCNDGGLRLQACSPSKADELRRACQREQRDEQHLWFAPHLEKAVTSMPEIPADSNLELYTSPSQHSPNTIPQ
eukprot:scaffold99034_cov69-Phaeocystis_antarctica.AAC.1